MKKIVIVDDEPNIVMTLEYTFKKNNYEVFIARDGEEAIQIIQKEKPDGVILDIMMPKVDGYETLKFIKSQADLKNCKSIFLTAKNKESDIEKGLALGVDAYITKPFSLKNVVEKMNSLLNE